MISISIVALVLWAIVGILGFVNYISGRTCKWIDYWLVYGVLIVSLVDKVVEELA